MGMCDSGVTAVGCNARFMLEKLTKIKNTRPVHPTWIRHTNGTQRNGNWGTECVARNGCVEQAACEVVFRGARAALRSRVPSCDKRRSRGAEVRAGPRCALRLSELTLGRKCSFSDIISGCFPDLGHRRAVGAERTLLAGFAVACNRNRRSRPWMARVQPKR